jgi:hypothetical protein
MPGPTATISPTQRDLSVLAVDEHGRMNWQKTSGYNTRSKVEAAKSRRHHIQRLAHDARPTNASSAQASPSWRSL